jgi:hypothetical protein
MAVNVGCPAAVCSIPSRKIVIARFMRATHFGNEKKEENWVARTLRAGR